MSTTSSFILKDSYQPLDGDILVFPFFDHKRPCFSDKLLPEGLECDQIPSKEGKTGTFFAGRYSGVHILAQAARLDEKYISPAESLKRKVASSLTLARDRKAARVILFLSPEETGLIRAAQEGAMLGGYTFDRYLKEKPQPVEVAAVTGQKPDAGLKKTLSEDSTVFEWANLARDVLNEPPNSVNPVSLARLFQDRGKNAGLKVSVWDEKRLGKERCGALLAVGKGASNPPRLVIGQYRAKKPRIHIALVGKGVTFDSGGYCLKPPASQEGMKYDMGGAAAVFGAACAIAALKLPVRLTVLTPLAENIVSDKAYLTSDIITTRSGKTVQVDNTDAEGRLILADALTIAVENKPDCIVDAATLTGACVVALGEDIAGIYGTDDNLVRQFTEAGRDAGEEFWPLPLYMPYMEQLKATIADCKNIGGKWGGSITGALFLKQFVDDETPWLHLDIAGPGVKEEPLGHLGKGAKGFGLRTLVAFVRSLASA